MRLALALYKISFLFFGSWFIRFSCIFVMFFGGESIYLIYLSFSLSQKWCFRRLDRMITRSQTIIETVPGCPVNTSICRQVSFSVDGLAVWLDRGSGLPLRINTLETSGSFLDYSSKRLHICWIHVVLILLTILYLLNKTHFQLLLWLLVLEIFQWRILLFLINHQLVIDYADFSASIYF